MKYLITDQELLDYVSGRMDGKTRREFENKAIKVGKTDLLLYAQLADYAATGTCTDDIIGEDNYIAEEDFNNMDINFPKAADCIFKEKNNEFPSLPIE